MEFRRMLENRISKIEQFKSTEQKIKSRIECSIANKNEHELLSK